MKNIYDEPQLMIVFYTNEDIVRTSFGGENGDDWAQDGGFGDFVGD